MKSSELEVAIKKELALFSDEITAKVAAVAETVAQEGKAKIATIGDYKDRTGKYRKSFYLKNEGSYRAPKFKLANKEWGLTHLLEDGHATKGGTGRTKASPHWKETEEFMISEFEKRVEQVLSE